MSAKVEAVPGRECEGDIDVDDMAAGRERCVPAGMKKFGTGPSQHNNQGRGEAWPRSTQRQNISENPGWKGRLGRYSSCRREESWQDERRGGWGSRRDVRAR